MKLDIKKIAFLGAGLSLAAAITVIGKNNMQTSLEGKKFGDWSVICQNEKAAEGDKKSKPKQKCFLNQQVIRSDKAVIADTKIGLSNVEKQYVAIHVVPLGASLRHGTAILADDKAMSPGVFTTCLEVGCIAAAPLTDVDIDAMGKAKNLGVVRIINETGERVAVPLSSKGLKEGLKALKSAK